jgi:hypothetical protein
MASTSWRLARPHLVVLGLLWLFAVVAFGVLGALRAWGSGMTTGDEPHYLIVADAIAHDHSFSPEAAYQRDATSESPLLPVRPTPSEVIAVNALHLVHGPHGWYSVHGVGLPLVLAPAVAIGGMGAARAVLVLLATAIVALVWAFSGEFATARSTRTFIVVPLCVSLPFLAGASQIYPDLLGGGLCLLGLFVLVHVHRGAVSPLVPVAATALALLPWLHLRFAAPSVILVVAIVWARSRHVGRTPAAAALAAPLVASVVLLASYHWWAFGNPAGPYGEDAASVSWHSLMVLFGLGVDQNQGIFAQQPLHLVGLFFVVSFVRTHRLLAVTMLLVVGSILVPNAVHPAWYGGYSYSGRFGWAASVILLPMTMFGLAELARRAPRVFAGVLVFGAGVQLWFVHDLLHGFLPLLNRPESTPLEQYSIHFGVLGRWLPALYDTGSALGHVPNAVALLGLAWLVVLGAVWREAGPSRVAA